MRPHLHEYCVHSRRLEVRGSRTEPKVSKRSKFCYFISRELLGRQESIHSQEGKERVDKEFSLCPRGLEGLLLENASMLNMCGVRSTWHWQRP